MDEHIEDQEDHLEELLSRYATDARVLKMREYIQHGTTTTYDHVIHVARMAMWLDAKIFGKADMEEICAAAILHDYYLYDWHDHGDRLHGYNHPYIAAENAKCTTTTTKKKRKKNGGK